MALSVIDFTPYDAATDSLDIWTAAYVDIAVRVPTAEVITVDVRWQANLPGLAEAKLGSKYLWWALLMYNGLSDAIGQVVPGRVLRVPDREALYSYLAARQAAQQGKNYLSPQSATVI